jgi:hypothetical protein
MKIVLISALVSVSFLFSCESGSKKTADENVQVDYDLSDDSSDEVLTESEVLTEVDETSDETADIMTEENENDEEIQILKRFLMKIMLCGLRRDVFRVNTRFFSATFTAIPATLTERATLNRPS